MQVSCCCLYKSFSSCHLPAFSFISSIIFPLLNFIYEPAKLCWIISFFTCQDLTLCCLFWLNIWYHSHSSLWCSSLMSAVMSHCCHTWTRHVLKVHVRLCLHGFSCCCLWVWMWGRWNASLSDLRWPMAGVSCVWGRAWRAGSVLIGGSGWEDRWWPPPSPSWLQRSPGSGQTPAGLQGHKAKAEVSL